MVTAAFNSFTNPFKSDNKTRLIHIFHQVYMFIKLIFERWLENEDKFVLPPIANNLLSMT